MWKDKKPIFFISSHARPIAFPCEVVKVPRRIGAHRVIHKEYTTFMRGVDVADHV